MDDLVKRLRNPKGDNGSDFNATYWVGLITEAADRIDALEKELFVRGCKNWDLFVEKSLRIEALEEALKKIATIEDEHINVPKTNEGANLWACLAMCVELAEAALGEKKDD